MKIEMFSKAIDQTYEIAFASLRLCGKLSGFRSQSFCVKHHVSRKGAKTQRQEVRYRLVCLVLLAGFLAMSIFNPHRTVHANNEAANSKHSIDEKTALIDQALGAA